MNTLQGSSFPSPAWSEPLGGVQPGGVAAPGTASPNATPSTQLAKLFTSNSASRPITGTPPGSATTVNDEQMHELVKGVVDPVVVNHADAYA